MNKILLLLLLVAPSLDVYAQHDEEEPPMMVVEDEGGDDFTFRLLFDGGITYARTSSLSSSLPFNDAGFRQLHTIGFGLNFSDEAYVEDGARYPGHDMTLAVHWFLPQTHYTIAENGDHAKYTMKGWELMTSILAINIIKNERVDCVIGLGAYYGNLKLSSYEVSTHASGAYTNPFAAPMLRTELRFNFGILTVGGRVSYRYDLTKDNWHRKLDNIPPLPGYHFREAQFLLYIGLRYFDYV